MVKPNYYYIKIAESLLFSAIDIHCNYKFNIARFR